MREALAEARRALAHDDVPIGAVIVQLSTGSVVARAHNTREQDADPTAHAELLALRAASVAAGRWRLDDHALVVTLEPCPMCAGAVWAARLPLLVFGAADPKAGAAGSLYNLAADPRLNHETEIVPGVLADDCGALLTEFFAGEEGTRRLAPPENRFHPVHLAPEGCESGRIGWSRKPLWRKSPWVQIPLPPLISFAMVARPSAALSIHSRSVHPRPRMHTTCRPCLRRTGGRSRLRASRR